ncbi:MAG: complexin-2 [Butyrivibrio sp.]|nr:complexin-2 [Butyrivibrio sp.]
MKREKSVQIPEKLFVEIAQYFFLDQRGSGMEKSIVKGISDKLEAVVRHDLYTKYKTAPTPEQQEQARLEYLDKAGIPDDFRW